MSSRPLPTPVPASRPLAARIGLWLGPALLLATLLLPAPGGLSPQAWSCAGLAVLMATWWATEPIPIPVTSLLPLLLVPALGLAGIDEPAARYADPTIFLFLGGFLLGIAMQRCGLHRRIALRTLLLTGSRPRRQVAGFMLATGFLSMWVSNTATAVMMLPIALSVIALPRPGAAEAERRRYGTALLLAVAYAASIGGIATLIGTPPNALLAAYLRDAHGIELGFARWLLLGLPVSAGMMALAWWWLTRGGFALGDAGDSGRLLREELGRLGPASSAERRVGVVFVLTALAWVLRPLASDAGLGWLTDTGIAMAAGIVLFVLPSGTDGRRLLDWDDAKDLPWGVLLLFGGGLALAAAIQSTGLAAWIARQMAVAGALPPLLLVGLVVLVVIFLTELTSNTATAAAFLPLLGALAVSVGMDPRLIAAPAAIAASCAFMMPVATPPNAIVFSTGQLPIQAMIRAGLFLNLAGVVLVTALAMALVRVV